jgi:hypothetical protein
MKNLKTLIILVMALVCSVEANATVYTDQSAFTAALAGLYTSYDFNSYPQGSIANGQALGAFSYSYDSTTTQPGIASNGIGGQALGDTSLGTDPNFGTGVFVSGEAVTLTYNGAHPLSAFGVNFSFAPNFESLPGNLYQLIILDGLGAGTTVGNLSGLSENGGSFFLGFIGDSFTSVSLQSEGMNYLTPAYQVNNLIYESSVPVPEPSTLLLLIVGGAALIPLMRKRA